MFYFFKKRIFMTKLQKGIQWPSLFPWPSLYPCKMAIFSWQIPFIFTCTRWKTWIIFEYNWRFFWELQLFLFIGTCFTIMMGQIPVFVIIFVFQFGKWTFFKCLQILIKVLKVLSSIIFTEKYDIHYGAYFSGFFCKMIMFN